MAPATRIDPRRDKPARPLPAPSASEGSSRAIVEPAARAPGWSDGLQEAGDAQPEALSSVDLLPAHLLDGGEIVIFAIKPSLWYVVFKSTRWLAAILLLILVVGLTRGVTAFFDPALIIRVALALAALRLGFGLLQWVSRLYVLTNRRVMRLTGILNLDLFECPLTKIQNTSLTMAWYERLFGLGTISFATAGTGGVVASWTNVNNPLELHERVRSAIHRANSSGP